MTTDAKPVSFILRDCEPSLWRRFKAKAKRDGHTLRWVLMDLIRQYVEAR